MIKESLTSKTETVYELKENEYKIPTFEEFMTTYKEDKSLNYEDLGYSDINDNKKYGACSSCRESNNTFRLVIVLKNCVGSRKSMTVHNTNSALKQASDIMTETGYWDEGYVHGYYARTTRRNLVRKVNQAIDEHRNDGKIVNRVVSSDDEIKETEPCMQC